MTKTFLKYFGISADKGVVGKNSIGFQVTRDDIVFVGILVYLIRYRIGFWIHKKGYVVSLSKKDQ